ncbi:MAG TPA: hypothetical protein VKE40_24040 [Gemmataceae bacterium]|nr:hypothetical protein [Gemmataceae bacterium]
MDDPNVTYAAKSDDELREIIVANYELSQAVVNANPKMAQDAGFELFDRAWAKRYWASVVSQVSGITTPDRLYNWAVGATIGAVAKAITTYYLLPAAAVPAAVALAIVLVRAAKASRKDPAAP